MKSNETQGAESLHLTGKQAKVLAALVSGATIETAAKANGTAATTVHQWLKRDEFRTAYREALGDVLTYSTGSLKAACAVAVETLREVAQDVNAPSAPRVSAARAILELSLKAAELEDMAERIEALEALNQ